MSNILFVYPNKEGYPIIPILVRILERRGHKVELFDCTFLMRERLDHNAREKTKVVIPVDVSKYWGNGVDDAEIQNKFADAIKSFNPDLIAFTIVENNYFLAKRLIGISKQHSKAPIVVGGIFPTVAKQIFLEDNNVDFICIGEGESSILRLADDIGEKRQIKNIFNIISKPNKEYDVDRFYPYYKWEPNIYQDWEIFDKRHLLKPFMGKMQRTGFFELSRGCPFHCSYCNNQAKQDIFRSLGNYRREKPISHAVEEISYFKHKQDLELVFFNDENFLQMGRDRFDEFCLKYESVGLPFFIQTRADTLLDCKRISKLKDVGCITIGVGIEHGSYGIRKNILSKDIPDDIYTKAFDICNHINMRTTGYIMLGIPFETEKNILETVEFCRKLKPTTVALSIFAPYYGTKLRKTCIDNNFMQDKLYENISVNYSSILDMPQLSREKIEEYYYKINDLIYS